MSNPAFLFTIAGVSMSFVGFSALYMTLRRSNGTWQGPERVEIAQLNGIVMSGLLTLFAALLAVPVTVLLGESTGFRLASAVLLAICLYLYQVRVQSSWIRWGNVQTYGSRRARLIDGAPFACVAILAQAMLIVDIIAPRQELYELALIMMLATPALIFRLVVAEMLSTARN